VFYLDNRYTRRLAKRDCQQQMPTVTCPVPVFFEIALGSCILNTASGRTSSANHLALIEGFDCNGDIKTVELKPIPD
jgi:hypothetical protein